MSLDALAAKTRFDGSRALSATAVQIVYYVDDSLNSEDASRATLDFEEHFIDACWDDFESDVVDAYCVASSSYKQLSDGEIDKNSIFVSSAMGVMVVYVTCLLFRFDAVRSRALLGGTIVLTVGLALLFALGVCGWVGVPFSVLSFLSLFIILGVGIDDMIIVVDARVVRRDAFPEKNDDDARRRLDRAKRRIPRGRAGRVPALVSAALGDSGCSILLTSLTDFVAFLVGSAIDLPAASYFCSASVRVRFLLRRFRPAARSHGGARGRRRLRDPGHVLRGVPGPARAPRRGEPLRARALLPARRRRGGRRGRRQGRRRGRGRRGQGGRGRPARRRRRRRARQGAAVRSLARRRRRRRRALADGAAHGAHAVPRRVAHGVARAASRRRGRVLPPRRGRRGGRGHGPARRRGLGPVLAQGLLPPRLLRRARSRRVSPSSPGTRRTVP